MIDKRRILAGAAAALVLACGERVVEPPSGFDTPSIGVVAGPTDDLQTVIDGAAPGSTILLEEGEYDLTTGGVTIDKPLTIEGADDAVILGSNHGFAVTVTGLEAGTVTFHGLRFEGGAWGIVADQNGPESEVVVEECVFIDVDLSVNAWGGSRLSVGNSLFKDTEVIAVFGSGAGVRVMAVDNTFEDMRGSGVQVQAEAYGRFERNTFNNCAVSGLHCIGFVGSSGEAVDNEINDTRRGINANPGDILIRDNKITQFSEYGILVRAAGVIGFDNKIEDALGGETDCAVVTGWPGTVQIVDNKLTGGDGVGIVIRSEQFNIEGTACVGA